MKIKLVMATAKKFRQTVRIGIKNKVVLVKYELRCCQRDLTCIQALIEAVT